MGTRIFSKKKIILGLSLTILLVTGWWLISSQGGTLKFPLSMLTGTSGPDFKEILAKENAEKSQVMEKHMAVLEARYDLSGQTTSKVTMSKGKPLPVGPTARLKEITWEQLAMLTPKEIKQAGNFPYLPLPHPLHANGGMVFPQIQLDRHPELVRFDVAFDLPDAYLPEFPPGLYLTTRPELGDVSQGQEITLDNYYDLFKEILTPVQLEGLRLLVTRFPQQQFNATDDRKSEKPSQGVACFDCHVNGHSTGQFHLNPDNRPQESRFRIETVSLRGLNIQQLFGSKRSLRSVEDFTEFEQRSAYFDGDHTLAAKKGINPLNREQVMHMAQFENIIAFPPAPKLDELGRLNPERAEAGEIRGEKLFFGKAKCSNCHPAPYYTDNLMHDLKVERFYKGRPEGQIKTFVLRGIKDSPPYFHDGRLLTLEDCVEFFNLVLQLKLNKQEKEDIVAFLRTL